MKIMPEEIWSLVLFSFKLFIVMCTHTDTSTFANV